MADEPKYRNLYDLALYGIPLLLIAVGIYFVRTPKVGVLNGERVAKDLGVTARLQDAERQWKGVAIAQFNEVTERNRPQIAALEARLDAAGDAVERKTLQDQIRRLHAESQLAADRSRQEFQSYLDGVRRQYHAKVDPLIAKVARSRHYDVVVDSSEGRAVSFVRPGVDITAEVIKESRSVISNLDFSSSTLQIGKPAVVPRLDFSKPAGAGAKK